MAEVPPRKAPDPGARTPDDGSEPFQVDGPSLDVDGRLINRIEKLEPQHPEAPLTEEPIELADKSPSWRDPTPESYRDAPKRSRGKAPLVFGLLVTIGVAVLAAVLFSRSARNSIPTGPLGRLVPVTHSPLMVTSEPEGATIRIGTEVVGKTPWAGDNIWGQAHLTLELPGYHIWSGTIPSGADAKVSARLTK